jgi:hypothetical protein
MYCTVCGSGEEARGVWEMTLLKSVRSLPFRAEIGLRQTHDVACRIASQAGSAEDRLGHVVLDQMQCPTKGIEE